MVNLLRRKFVNKAIGFESKEARDMYLRRYALDHPTEWHNYNDSCFSSIKHNHNSNYKGFEQMISIIENALQ